MILVAIDPHKATHVVAGVDASTGHVRGERAFASTHAGVRLLRKWAIDLAAGDELVYAVEDNRYLTRRLESELSYGRARVIRVPPKLTAQRRQRERERGKSDAIDARAIARAALEQGVGSLSEATFDPAIEDLRVLIVYRDALVRERCREILRLRGLLFDLSPEFEGAITRTQWQRLPVLGRVEAFLAAQPASAATDIAARHTRRMRGLFDELAELQQMLDAIVEQTYPSLVDIPGCGVISAASLIARTAPAERFPTAGHFARHAGVAPLPAGSGQSSRLRRDPGGNRQVNAALHTIAMTQSMFYEPAQEYIARKQQEGKTRRAAMRCLKRHIARRVWREMVATERLRRGSA
jgi:transposase